MYEVVKVVNGHEIKRAVGTRGCYHVVVWDHGNGFSRRQYFRTIKAAAAFCETF